METDIDSFLHFMVDDIISCLYIVRRGRGVVGGVNQSRWNGHFDDGICFFI